MKLPPGPVSSTQFSNQFYFIFLRRNFHVVNASFVDALVLEAVDLDDLESIEGILSWRDLKAKEIGLTDVDKRLLMMQKKAQVSHLIVCLIETTLVRNIAFLSYFLETVLNHNNLALIEIKNKASRAFLFPFCKMKWPFTKLIIFT